ncbi:C4-dicarboxylate ABC transporter [Bifidobacterium amazonense]|uniref:C4-dicarboxylate ABC transporter n=1 Tax=Bifidobacterium amazonense TaxID=2809027 RepID=A0ABS9VYN7_9BIFI|nr:C4-dicarboxylate ABC transporter [Bifidobacterium amazonense]MCH9277162.1 C4-dicarboxylate ABC transporter [Bifidobacterium amazonense]
MTDLMPMLLWVLSILWSGGVCTITAVRGRFLSGERHPEVEPVSWNVVYAQVASVVLVAVPFITLILTQHDIDPGMMAFYERFLIAGAIVGVAMIVLEWALMFMQAKRAERTQMDRVLRSGAHR